MADLTHEELIKGLARTIMLARENGGCIVTDWAAKEKYSPHVAQALAQARAAAAYLREALKEPTEAMKLAGCKQDDPLGELVDWSGAGVTTREVVAGVFRAMLLASPLYEEGK